MILFSDCSIRHENKILLLRHKDIVKNILLVLNDVRVQTGDYVFFKQMTLNQCWSASKFLNFIWITLTILF